MEQQRNARKGSRLQRQIEELQKRIEAVEDILDNAKEVLTVEEAARFMDIARSSLYKMTSDRSIPFYRPNGKMIYFEKADILAWMRRNRTVSQEEVNEHAQQVLQKMAMDYGYGK
ncbi:MAG: helix-turn-helix domain-containing protein [Bacteroidaceae bacterium]|nr:helix-turn-helix domain-containing protein [Bacteroidaceae bacterium]